MKIRLLITFFVLFLIGQIRSQALSPVIVFNESPVTYNMHICSDDSYYYTANGGVAEDGKITVYNLQGIPVATYPIKLDMRSIMYNRKDKSLYVNTIEKVIYKIIDIEVGTYEVLYSGLYNNIQASLAIGYKGKYIYAFENGTLSVYKFSDGSLVKTLSGLKCGEREIKGSVAVAVDKHHIYTWDSDKKTVYAYDLDGRFIRSFILSQGDFGYSLSYANGLIFVAHSESGKTGTWYGYDLWGK